MRRCCPCSKRLEPKKTKLERATKPTLGWLFAVRGLLELVPRIARKVDRALRRAMLRMAPRCIIWRQGRRDDDCSIHESHPWLFSRPLLANSHCVLFVEAKNLAGLKPDCSPRIAKLHAIELHASLFDQPRGLAARFLQVERLPINVRNERDGFKFLQRGRGKQRQVGMFQIALAKTRVPFIECFLGESSRMVGLHDFAGKLPMDVISELVGVPANGQVVIGNSVPSTRPRRSSASRTCLQRTR